MQGVSEVDKPPAFHYKFCVVLRQVVFPSKEEHCLQLLQNPTLNEAPRCTWGALGRAGAYAEFLCVIRKGFQKSPNVHCTCHSAVWLSGAPHSSKAFGSPWMLQLILCACNIFTLFTTHRESQCRGALAHCNGTGKPWGRVEVGTLSKVNDVEFLSHLHWFYIFQVASVGIRIPRRQT